MKKSHLIAGAAVLAGALTFVIYINTKSSPRRDGEVAQIADVNEPANDFGADGYKSYSSGTDMAPMSDQGQPTPVSGDPKTQKLEAFVQASRVAEEFRFLDEQMDQQFERMKNMAGPEELATFEELRNQLKGDQLLAEYKEVLKEKFSEAEFEQLNEVYKSPEFIRFKANDAHYRTPEGRKDLMEWGKTFKPSELQDDRREALVELIKESGAAEQTIGMLGSVGNLFGSATGAGKMKKPETEQYQKMIEKSINDALVMTHAKSFKDQPIEAIRDMTKVLGNPVLRRAEAAKVEYITQKLVKVVEPKLKEAMEKK